MPLRQRVLVVLVHQVLPRVVLQVDQPLRPPAKDLVLHLVVPRAVLQLVNPLRLLLLLLTKVLLHLAVLRAVLLLLKPLLLLAYLAVLRTLPRLVKPLRLPAKALAHLAVHQAVLRVVNPLHLPAKALALVPLLVPRAVPQLAKPLHRLLAPQIPGHPAQLLPETARWSPPMVPYTPMPATKTIQLPAELTTWAAIWDHNPPAPLPAASTFAIRRISALVSPMLAAVELVSEFDCIVTLRCTSCECIAWQQ